MCRTKIIKTLSFTSTLLHPCEASFSLFWLIYVHCTSMLNFSKHGEQQILGWNLPQKFVNDQYFEKYDWQKILAKLKIKVNINFNNSETVKAVTLVYEQNSDRDVSDFRISDQSLIKRNCHNSRTSDDTEMNRES